MDAPTPQHTYIRGEWKQFCSPHLFISRKKTQTVVLSRRWAHYAVFFLVKAQSYLPPPLPQGPERGQRLSRALLPQERLPAEPHRLTVSAKLAHAVHRNRLRRQLREIYRLHEAQFARGYDIVVVARTRAIGADYAALERAYLSLAAKLGLLGGQTA